MRQGVDRTAGQTATRIWSALVAALIAIALVAPAAAQEREQRRGLFQFLFGGGIRQAEPERRPVPVRKRPRTASRPALASPSAAAAPRAVAVEKQAEAKVVLVVGDFLASGLGEALTDVFADNPAVRIVSRSNGSSGFVRDDHFDWPAGIGQMIDEEKPAAVVVMLGANDRQEMRLPDRREPKRSEAWNAAYEQRVAAFAKAVRDRGTPLVWVGMVPFKVASMSSDMVAFNDVYRSEAEEVGGTFVDVWDGFVDENGAYVSTGPDINGQPVRLRSGDNGISLTAAGKRKVAFYVEKPLQRLLGIDRPATPGTISTTPTAGAAPTGDGVVDRTAPISLTDPELDGGTELLGATVVQPSPDVSPPLGSLAAGAPPPGRADNFSAQPAATATVAPVPDQADAKTTAAIRP